MAYLFSKASSQSITSTPGVLNGASTATLAMRAKRNNTANSLTSGFGTSNSRFEIYWASTNGSVYAVAENGSGSYGYSNKTDTAWRSIVITFNGGLSGNSNRLKEYFEGVLQTLIFTGTIPATLASSLGTFYIGREPNVEYSTGDIADVALWNTDLTTEEIASYNAGFKASRIRPQSLVFSAPLTRSLVEIRGSATLTNNNGATVSDHPRVY